MRPPRAQVLVQRGHQCVGLRRRPGPYGLLDEVEEALDALGVGPPGHGIDTRPAAHPWDHASVPPIDRLSALDSAFLDLDSAQAPLHVGWTILVEGRAPSLVGAAPPRRGAPGARAALPPARRAPAPRARRPALGRRRRLRHRPPRPRVTLAPPAGPGELRELAGALLSAPLDPGHPLWRMYLVGGLRGGGWAVVGQAHHALVDGIAAVEVAMLLFDAAGHAPAPSTAGALGAGRRRRRRRAAVAAFARGRLAGAARGARGRRRATVAPRRRPPRRRAPARGAGARPPRWTARPPTAARVGFGVTSLDGAREAGRRHGATINDVLLAASTLALGRALRRRGERPATVKVARAGQRPRRRRGRPAWATASRSSPSRCPSP